MGWQPSRLLSDRAEAERAYGLAERLGSVNVAELGAAWHRLGRGDNAITLGLSLGPELAQLTRTYGRRVQRSSP